MSLFRSGARLEATLLLAFMAAWPGVAPAQETLEEIVVIGVTPNQDQGLPEGKIPYHVQSATKEDIQRSQSLDLSDFLNRNLGSVSLNDAQNNPLQPDLQYRGFSASPLLGLAQGLAVYQNGVRINEPLGDTTNWDLLPESAIQGIDLIGGANPLFGLNTLGGALAVRMKNGFEDTGHSAEAWGGSFGRWSVTGESGANSDSLAYYANVQYLEEEGWRDLSESDTLNFYGSLGWRNEATEINLNGQHGDSFLTGNGPVPVELMNDDRDAIFTAPDITEHDMWMASLDGSHDFSGDVKLSGTAFYRINESDSFNGDSSEYALCRLGGDERLLEGLEDEDLEELGLEDDDVCQDQFSDAQALEDFLEDAAAAGGEPGNFNLDDLGDELSGTGVLADAGINNQSTRAQKSYGIDMQAAFLQDLFKRGNQLIAGAAWYRGTSAFDSVTELAEMNPDTRSTAGLGTGTFVDGAATDIETETESWSVYFTDTIDLSDRLSLTLSGRYNNTSVNLADQSGERPELNGEHDFHRFNPALGLTFQATDRVNFYAGYSESSRAPTPIELACNDQVFELARANAIAGGEDPEDIEFECRLPNAFLADPPLDQVVAKSWEAGTRGSLAETVQYKAGLFRTTNKNDIIFQSTGRATGLFANVDETRRLGFEGALSGTFAKLDWFVAYSYIDATFQDDLEVLSPNHDLAEEEEGTIEVEPGDRIPGIPEHQLKAGGEYYFTERLSLGFDALYHSNQVMRGDESNQLDEVDGYALLNLRGRWRVTGNFEFFARINNVLDNEYETFGLVGEDPGGVAVPAFQNYSDPRFLGPGAPLSGFVGLRISM